MYRISFTSAAARDIRSLPHEVARRVVRAIEKLAENPRPNGVRKLEGSDPLYRIRVGDYRVIYDVRDDEIVVVVVRVRHRKDVYR